MIIGRRVRVKRGGGRRLGTKCADQAIIKATLIK